MSTLLIIDDDLMILMILKQTLSKAGYSVLTASSGEEGIKTLVNSNIDLVLTDYMMPGMSGIEVLNTIKKNKPLVPVIMLTAHGDVPLTIKAIQLGAADFIEKPIQSKELVEVIKRTLEIQEQALSVSKPFSKDSRKVIEENPLIGKAAAMREIFKNIGRISLNRISVLINGETGTGKELIAKLIHHSGVTREYPFTIINCSSINDDALSNEMFGYEKGAFAGANENKKGKFELAGEGTILLDEISNLSDNLQIKLFRVLQDLEFEKPGITDPLPLKARIIASSNKNLEHLIAEGRFREELYYRLKVFTIDLPPLRKRKDDIDELTQFFIQKYNRKLKKEVNHVGEGFYEKIKSYDWPGNIRELENSILQAMIVCKGNILEKADINLAKNESITETISIPVLATIAEIEKVHIKQVLDKLNWNKVETSKALDISRPTLNAKIEKYELKPNNK
ncbi:MAG: sigma-54-dependent transcriptional regulator [Bacteroidales bacterium]